MSSTFEGFIKIDDHGLLLVQGIDARAFLQGQVTCDINSLYDADQNTSTLGAHCTPKGRVLFSFRAFALTEDTIALSIITSLIADAQKNLQKYSVFSKVDIIDASDTYQILGFCNTGAQQNANITTLPNTNQAIATSQGTIVAINDTHFEYYLDKDSAEQLLQAYPASTDSTYWEQVKIAAGIGEISPNTVDTLIPQMLNYQAIGAGISFTKGCYTGQEVVARMQYLGKLKRRLFRFTSDYSGAVSPGEPLFTEGKTQSIGNIISVYRSENKVLQLLAVATEDAVKKQAVYLDQNGQEKLQQQPLPYAIPNE